LAKWRRMKRRRWLVEGVVEWFGWLVGGLRRRECRAGPGQRPGG